MNITYHKKISTPAGICIKNIPHSVLDKKIREFIEERGVVQSLYYTRSNGYYFFIYLECNDRIDIEL